jgi:cellulose synthase/poly-beta-1,6-N-acetylglucosamine synthase-like glycosyltransferase
VFWLSAALLAYAQAGYGLLVGALARLSPRAEGERGSVPPSVAVIVAAHNEEDVIAAKVRDARALAWPGRVELVVACDGCSDGTAEAARAAGADLVLNLPRGGKVRAQDAAVERTTAELLAFSDANARWEPDALQRLAEAFSDPRVGYACGRVSFVKAEGGDNQEGLYWRYELWLRAQESRFCSITAGNGAIYAVRREAYLNVDPIMGHDLSLPFNLVKRGWLAVYVPEARATEKMVPTVEGEFARKRRMMGHTWPIVVRGGLADPRGYPLRYLPLVASHRLLRYATPFLHVALLLASLRRPWALLAHLGVVGAALSGRGRVGLISRYYVLTTASIALGLFDWLRHGTRAEWDPVEEAR